jgi:anthranilate synthase component I
MQQIKYNTTAIKMSSDIFTPLGIYLRVRDQCRDSVLLESTDFNSEENSYSFIGINAIAGVEIKDINTVEYRFPNEEAKQIKCSTNEAALAQVENFTKSFVAHKKEIFPLNVAQGLLGYISYNSVSLFENISLQKDTLIPLLRFRFYQYIIAINHFKDELYLIENNIDGVPSVLEMVKTCITKKDVPQFPFATTKEEASNITDEGYKKIVQSGINHCLRGDVFQVVLSRKFEQQYIGDEFNVYRALRNINPSPYLFYFDYGNYKLFGSSPESQIIVKNGTAIIHPIAGTVKRTGNNEEDKKLTQQLIEDPKENAEHIMLVDLARNDLSQFCNNVAVNYFKQLKHYSHLVHLVSEVSGTIIKDNKVLEALGKSFPAGTLSGAPKYKAMQIINELEKDSRGYYAGAIGMLGFDGSCNMAIMIRTFLSKNNTLHFQAGAGVVAASKPENELQEVNNKVGALRAAIQLATKKTI